MSRLIIKNLPSYLTPDGLRKHFAQNGAPPGTITDLKISHKRDGTSRRFGFVGFKTEKEAAAARDWFDKTCVDSTRISVAVVEGVSFFSFLSLSSVLLTFVGGGERCTSTIQTAADRPRSVENDSNGSKREDEATSSIANEHENNGPTGYVPRSIASPKRTLMGE